MVFGDRGDAHRSTPPGDGAQDGAARRQSVAVEIVAGEEIKTTTAGESPDLEAKLVCIVGGYYPVRQKRRLSTKGPPSA
jgi:hypothetical protein